MSESEPINDPIHNALIQVETLEKEYALTFIQYQEAYNNYINTLNCSTYNDNSVGISQNCYNKIWSDQGCTTQAPNIGSANSIDKNPLRSLTLAGLVQDSYLWAISPTQKLCNVKGTLPTTAVNPTKFTILSGKSWWGTGKLQDVSPSTLQECESMCLSDQTCSGATFNPERKYCWTRTGDASIAENETGNNNQALIRSNKFAIINLKSLNDKLLSLNKQISKYLQDINPQVEKQQTENGIKHAELQVHYDDLLMQKRDMEQQLQDYYLSEQNNDNQSLMSENQNTKYFIWSLVTILIIMVTIKQIVGPEFIPFVVFYWVIIAMIFIILSLNLRTPIGFMLWGAYIIFIYLIK